MSVKTRVEPKVIFCVECEEPWGVILPRAYDQADESRADLALLRACKSRHAQHWEDSSTEGERPPFVPPISRLTAVVFMATSSARWLSEEVSIDVPAESECWNEIENCDLPAWWVNRRRRWALRTNCSCDTVPTMEGHHE